MNNEPLTYLQQVNNGLQELVKDPVQTNTITQEREFLPTPIHYSADNPEAKNIIVNILEIISPKYLGDVSKFESYLELLNLQASHVMEGHIIIRTDNPLVIEVASGGNSTLLNFSQDKEGNRTLEIEYSKTETDIIQPSPIYFQLDKVGSLEKYSLIFEDGVKFTYEPNKTYTGYTLEKISDGLGQEINPGEDNQERGIVFPEIGEVFIPTKVSLEDVITNIFFPVKTGHYSFPFPIRIGTLVENAPRNETVQINYSELPLAV